MRLHSDRYETVRAMYTTALRMLRSGEPIPIDFEMRLIGAGINVESLREIVDFENRKISGFSMVSAE